MGENGRSTTLRAARLVRPWIVLALAVGAATMAWSDGLTKNWARLEDDPSEPALRPIALDLPVAEAIPQVTSAVAALPRWAIVEANTPAGTLHVTRRTLVWRFTDDVRLRFEPTADGGCRILGESRSRVGKGDLGQNARNLKELRAALERAGLADPRR
jgi:uncharacterized protein (DUF1499 family)